MDDFRVGSISQDASYRDRGDSNTRNRKKDKQTKEPVPETRDDVVLFSERSDADETVEDYYSPSRRDDD